MKNTIIILLFTITLSCVPKNAEKEKENNFQTTENNPTNNECNFEDGFYEATVNYYNPKTSHTATYTLDVDVVDCQVVQINFPNGGHLDEDHITAADIDNEGYAIVEGEEGKTYDIQIEN